MVRFANDQFVFLLYENVAPSPIVRSVTFERFPRLNVPAPVTVRFETPSIVPEFVNVVTVEIISGGGKSKGSGIGKCCNQSRLVTLASLVAAIVPAFVTVVMFETVEVAGSWKFAPALFVNVVGLRVRVESAGKVMVPELVTVIVAVFEKVVWLEEKFMVPEFVKCLFATDVETVIGEADEKLIVLSALLVKTRVCDCGKNRD